MTLSVRYYLYCLTSNHKSWQFFVGCSIGFSIYSEKFSIVIPTCLQRVNDTLLKLIQIFLISSLTGKDDKGFAMYIDRQRSWFQHNSIHERRVEGGISTGSTVGVLLDLERHTLHFIVNEMPQGSVAFRDLYGVFYPAVSVNRGVTLTLHTGLFAPHMDYH